MPGLRLAGTSDRSTNVALPRGGSSSCGGVGARLSAAGTRISGMLCICPRVASLLPAPRPAMFVSGVDGLLVYRGSVLTLPGVSIVPLLDRVPSVFSLGRGRRLFGRRRKKPPTKPRLGDFVSSAICVGLPVTVMTSLDMS